MPCTTTLRAAQRTLLAGSGLAASLTLAWGQSVQPMAVDGQSAARPQTPVMALAPAATAVEAMLARDWQPSLNPALYLVSEKLDGVRALWDGKTLRFRSGRAIAAPAWFMAGLPITPLDGELWTGRRQFDRVSATVRRSEANDSEWRAVRYRVFDLPADARPFALRAAGIADVVQRSNTPWLQAVEHARVSDQLSLKRLLAAVVGKGGEGLMLHHQDALRRPGRSEHLRKLKATPDEEGLVIAHMPGKGKFTGRMGALQLQMPDGKRFALGSGFTDAQRNAPPAIGSSVTYRFRDRTATGLPRFASVVRVATPD